MQTNVGFTVAEFDASDSDLSNAVEPDKTKPFPNGQWQMLSNNEQLH